MKVLFFSHQSEFLYGGEICTLAYMRELKRKGVEVLFAAPEGPYLEEAKKIVKVFPVQSGQFRRDLSSLLQIPKLFRETHQELTTIIKDIGVDLLHVTSLKAMAFQLFFPKSIPLIWHHHDILPDRWDNTLWLKMLGKKADLILVPSDASNRALKKLSVERVQTLHNGFSSSEWILKKARTSGEPFRVGMVGEISFRKGADRWQKIVSLAVQRMKAVEFRIIGEGLSDPFFAEEIIKSLQSYPVQFLGRRSDMKNQYSELDAILVLSRQDPLPTVIIEAGFSGVPAIGTKVGGIPELIESGKTGELVDSDEEVIVALEKLAKPEVWMSYSEAAQKRMQKNFSIENLTTKLILQYERLLKEREF